MTQQAPVASAGVRFPPPFIYALGILAGWLLDRRWRWAITDHSAPWRPFVVAALIVAWFALFIAAVARFRRAGTSIIPNKPVSAFVVSGPYRFSRNPMYVSLTALYLGVALILDSWWPIVLLPVVLIVIQRAVIAREERYLRQRFPEEYSAYCARVRRWL
jgi:protein-S-isoprenylcysteine O-methyltransferase Ste14